MTATPIAYLNGDFLPLSEARISPLDRGFLFADGVYEVVPAYAGRLLRLGEHLRRLRRSLDGIRLDDPHDEAGWTTLLNELVRRNGEQDQNVYLQVTRGADSARAHDFPDAIAPTVFAMTSPNKGPDLQVREQGVAVISLPDTRWQRCDLKTVALLSNVLLKQQAEEVGAAEALLVRDGRVIEGSSSNVFAVIDGHLLTPPESPHMLSGITRDLVLELARAHGFPCVEREVTLPRLRQADEIWITSSTREVVPVCRLDGVAVGTGRPGSWFRRMYDLYQDYKVAQ